MTFLRIVRYKLAIASYKVQFSQSTLYSGIFLQLQVHISQFWENLHLREKVWAKKLSLKLFLFFL